VKLVVAPSAPVASLPLVAFAPPQPPEAVQLVALVELQVNVEEAPLATVPGAAASDTVGVGGVTVTVTVRPPVPPGPVQVSVKSEVALSAPVDWLPLVALAPVQVSDAVQLVASVELHVKVEAWPVVIEPGFAASATVGAGGVTVTVTV
jgi:hypothetical protein